MRCPKCGFNSFDYLDSCKKCGKDLVEFKQRYGIQSILFPGQTTPETSLAESEYGDAGEEAAVAAVAAATVDRVAESEAAVPVREVEPTEEAVDQTGGDDFGFDFMGDSAEEDDLSFDELFEEAPDEEDVEETIEGPKQEAQEADGEEFSFDLPEDDDLEDDFGVDFETDEETSSDKNPNAASGTGEDPKSPFDLPESSESLGAPDSEPADFGNENIVARQSEPGPPVDDDPGLFDESSAPAGNEGSSAFEQVSSHDLSAEHEEALYAEFYKDLDASLDVKSSEEGEPAFVMEAADEDPESSAEKLEGEGGRFEGTAAGYSIPAMGKRIFASFCDLLLLVIVGGSFVLAAEAAMGGGEDHLLPSITTLVDLSIPYFLVVFSLFFCYFTLFHFLVGQTPGKMLTGLRVETVAGEPLGFSQAFLRSVGGLLQLVPAGLGYLAIYFNAQQRGWNDLLAGTRVVDLKIVTEQKADL